MRFYIDGVNRLAAGHEQPVPLDTPEANVRADLREMDLADEIAIRSKNMHAIEPLTDPTRT